MVVILQKLIRLSASSSSSSCEIVIFTGEICSFLILFWQMSRYTRYRCQLTCGYVRIISNLIKNFYLHLFAQKCRPSQFATDPISWNFLTLTRKRQMILPECFSITASTYCSLIAHFFSTMKKVDFNSFFHALKHF